jgi:hypothetical protein
LAGDVPKNWLFLVIVAAASMFGADPDRAAEQADKVIDKVVLQLR